ncbi:MAG TPA: hypothetical protein VNS58_10595 [Puia sp.]|nr:hypothetical protein [Puia sp.]
MVKTYIVIPEGLSMDEAGRFYPSDYYIAALDKVRSMARDGDRIYLAPANTFGAHQAEDFFGRDYLKENHCPAGIGVIDETIPRTGYLDTLDNAVYLKKHLVNTGRWPLEEVILVCNRPHRWRGWCMFFLCGYRIERVLGSRPSGRTGRKMVERLWFYDFPAVQFVYELAAIAYDTIRWLIQKKR